MPLDAWGHYVLYGRELAFCADPRICSGPIWFVVAVARRVLRNLRGGEHRALSEINVSRFDFWRGCAPEVW